MTWFTSGSMTASREIGRGEWADDLKRERKPSERGDGEANPESVIEVTCTYPERGYQARKIQHIVWHSQSRFISLQRRREYTIIR